MWNPKHSHLKKKRKYIYVSTITLYTKCFFFLEFSSINCAESSFDRFSLKTKHKVSSVAYWTVLKLPISLSPNFNIYISFIFSIIPTNLATKNRPIIG